MANNSITHHKLDAPDGESSKYFGSRHRPPSERKWTLGASAMKFVLASWGSRGDVEPCAAVGRELAYRGHEVRMAVPQDLVAFCEAAGLASVSFGLSAEAILEAHRNFTTCVTRNPWRARDVIRLYHDFWELLASCREGIRTRLASLADGSDLLLTGQISEGTAADVAESYGIPLTTLHTFPIRPNSQFLPFLPSPLARSAIVLYEWLDWRLGKKAEDVQRLKLGLPQAIIPPSRRVSNRGSLEIQAYDEVVYPGLAAEWTQWSRQRPFVGALTMELATNADEEAMAWIASATPPIYFGFGSVAVESPAVVLDMISSVCGKLGERALVCSGWTDFRDIPHPDHVKVVDAVNHALAFPACRAVVHHGGSGTAAAALRAGVPQLILWTTSTDRAMWAARAKRLGVGTGRRLSSTTEESLVADLRTILAPEYGCRAQEIATRMTKPTHSVQDAADLVEEFVHQYVG